MRDSERIKPLLKKIEEIWLKNPDWRFSQLIDNAITSTGINGIPLFYIEDEDLKTGLILLEKQLCQNSEE